MYNSFKQYIHNIGRRAKKLVWLLILLPILTAGVAYLLSANTPTSYKASTTILLGNFENTDGFTSPTYLPKLIPSEYFLSNLNEKYDLDINPAEASRSLTVTQGEDKTINLTLIGNDREETERKLSSVTDAFLKEGTELFRKKEELMDKTINDLKAAQGQLSDPGTATGNLYEVQMDKYNSKNSVLFKEVTSSPVSFISPMNKAILGLILGLFLNIAILVLPEIFRRK
ncbi:hypothetical protein [Bacillus sp. CECT 9360]|uniref:hypothetical protein n=1 Tax=Bacillus sp. CECT 9360 TaxID=2845821 RepID=UPI001E4352E4|nr:hypothetical protein [Bacillus sp. CECT 9360]CAH0344866.1 Teichuronic acid biosynthesis protein TuaF [Bacillus sp. CECT 9360]